MIGLSACARHSAKRKRLKALQRTWARRREKARPWPGERYLSRPIVYSEEAVASIRWQKRTERRAECGAEDAAWWTAGVRKDGRRWHSPVLCHQREHDHCRDSEARERIRAFDPNWLGTFTYRQSRMTRRVRDWRFCTLPGRLKRLFGLLKKWLGAFPYVWVRECHKNGNPHIHVAMRLNFKESEVGFELDEVKDKLTLLAGSETIRKIRRLWMICGGGWSTRIELIRESAEYICKYLSKQDEIPDDVHALVACNKLRDWSGSWGLRPKRTELEWAVAARGDRAWIKDVSCTPIEEVRFELAERRAFIREKAIEKEAKRLGRLKNGNKNI